jgi:NADPH-dependent 2,4-dienoyl-CoA reductase/sulfur reductase-like enzyme/nitrite reductase/ring-hydroxylating ferredoxin subunit
MTYHLAAHLPSLADGMTAVEPDGVKLLLVRDADGVRAFEGECPHAKAPLEQGALCEGRIICPWHMGTFDARTGALLEPVAMRGLHRHAVRVEGDDVLVDTDPTTDPAPPRQPDDRVFAIAGTGAAAAMAAVTLRTAGFPGRIRMIGPDAAEPLDRTNLSKMALADAAFDRSMLPLLGADPEVAPAVERSVTKLVRIDAANHRMLLADGETLHYDAALLATGAAPTAPPFPGADHALTLRSLGDVDAILRHVAPGASAVVIGTSFIGMEVAAALAERKMHVTVVGEAALPFASLFGERVGSAVRNLFVKQEVGFRLGARVAQVEHDAVVLTSGERLPATLIVAGTGVKPVLDYAPDLGKEEDGGLTADTSLLVAPGLWAAGDIVSPAGWPRIEHWRLAQQHGRLAALGMLGHSVRYKGVPFFWSAFCGQRLHCVGQTAHFEEIAYDGDVEGFDFIAWYLKGGKVAGALMCSRDAAAATLSHALRHDRSLAEARKAVGIGT